MATLDGPNDLYTNLDMHMDCRYHKIVYRLPILGLVGRVCAQKACRSQHGYSGAMVTQIIVSGRKQG